MRKVIIGHVNLQAGFRGGERQTELLIRELSARGFKQRLITRNGSALSERLSNLPGLEIREIAKPFMLHSAAAKGCDLLHAHETKAAQFALLVKKFHGIPYVITRRVPKIPKNNFFTRAVYSNATKITALSGAIRNNLLKLDPELDITIIPSMVASLAVNTNKVNALREQFGSKFVIGNIGALVNYHKGQQYLIEAAQCLKGRVSDIAYLFLGDGKDEEWLKSLAAGHEDIYFLGFVDNVGDYIELFDLFVFPSLQEGLGSILLDVMRARKPIIASDVDGIPDLIKHEVNGILVPPGDSRALEQEMERLYTDKALRQRLSEKAATDVQEYYPEKITQRIIDSVYSKITFNRR